LVLVVARRAIADQRTKNQRFLARFPTRDVLNRRVVRDDRLMSVSRSVKVFALPVTAFTLNATSGAASPGRFSEFWRKVCARVDAGARGPFDGIEPLDPDLYDEPKATGIRLDTPEFQAAEAAAKEAYDRHPATELIDA
jgi:hypothetical protein